MTGSTYAVGRGKPPLHTQFKKGQSGNPSGKPGPAKLAKQRFERTLLAALESSLDELQAAGPKNALAAMARQIALNAAAGRVAAQRLVLSLLDSQCVQEARTDEALCEQPADALGACSLVQGRTQGNAKSLAEQILALIDGELDPVSGEAIDPPGDGSDEPAPPRNEAEPVSQVQGKNQGNGKNELEPPDAIETTERIREALAPRAIGARAMMSSAAVSLADASRFGVPPPAI